jgi:hypothetical protein
MKTNIAIFNDILTKVSFFSKQLNLKLTQSTGRPLAIKAEEVMSLGIFKQQNGIPTKKSIWRIFNLKCSYKTLVVNLNKLNMYTLLILKSILLWNQKHAHIVKHTDSTDIPVCLNRNVKHHRTMREYAHRGHLGKGFFYGLKMSITTDLKRQLLAFSFAPGNGNDRETFRKMNKDLRGIFLADAGYLSKDLEREFFIEGQRILFTMTQARYRKVITDWQKRLYDTRMQIELSFRNLKLFNGLLTSLPRSVGGYFGNYIYALLAFVLG